MLNIRSCKRIAILISLVFTLSLIGLFSSHWSLILRLYDGAYSYLHNGKRVNVYKISTGSKIEDITERLLNDDSIPDEIKKPIIKQKRRILIFKYLSQGHPVAGYISYLPGSAYSVIFLRGGNGHFGIMRPNNPFSFIPDTTVIGTLYRGNLYESQDNDQFGGEDLNDILELYKTLPSLRKTLNLTFPLPKAIVGVSRGAMQMVASVAHSNFLKNKIKLLISISGNLDFRITNKERAEMHYLFNKKFKQQNKFSTLSDWISHRNPAELVSKLPNTINIALFYGCKDNRVPRSEQISFIESLRKYKIHYDLIEIENASHSLDGKQFYVNTLIYRKLKRMGNRLS